MKKLLIFAGILATSLSIAGCSGTNESAVINRLSHQLDRTANTVNTINQDTSSDIAIENISRLFSDKATTSQISVLSEAYQSSANAASGARGLSSKINKKIINIKKSIAGNLKLGNENTGTINELTTSMQKYTSNLNKTKSEYKNAAKAIYKIGEENESEQLNVKLARLSCCVEARNCYMQNLLLTLENIENILNGLEDNQNENEVVENEQNDYQNDLETQNIQNNAQIQNQMPINQNYNANNGYYNQQPFYPNATNYGGVNGYNGNFNYPYAYGNGAGGYGWRGGFNPDRNTDTYGPGVTNIDTYKFNGNNRRFNGSNGINMIDNDTNDETDILQENTNDEENHESDAKEQILPINYSNNYKIESNVQSLPNNPQIKKHRIMQTLDNRETFDDVATGEDGLNQDENIEFADDEKIKIRSVGADVDQEKEEEKEEEKIQGENKIKGHTQTEADINKDIENLIKKPS